MTKVRVMNAKRNIRGVLTVLDEYRTRFDLSCDDFVIYAAIGEANVTTGSDEVVVLRPTNIADVSYGLGIPKETVRRKVLRLIDRGLVKRNSNGIYVADLAGWTALGCSISEGGEPPAEGASKRGAN
jgi:hypothetical protein